MSTEHQREIWRKSRNKYRSSTHGKEVIRLYRNRTRDKYRIKDNARKMVQDHIRYNKLEKPEGCTINTSECSGRIEAHHKDYSKPLEVEWLCVKHHNRKHYENAS